MQDTRLHEASMQLRAEDEKNKRNRILIGVGIGLVVIIAGVLIYRRMN